ncbi:MAG: glycosyltransferase [Chloroflexota bacterium]
MIWSGPIYDPSGYASELRLFARALVSAGMTPRLEEVRWSQLDARLPAEDRAFLEGLCQAPLAKDYVRVWHIFPTAFRRDYLARLTVGRTMFETDRLFGPWAEGCKQVDQVWVPSEFNVETFGRGGVPVEKLRVLPGCVDTQRFRPGPSTMSLKTGPLGTGRNFNFLSILEWIPRKGWDVLLRAWGEEFAPDEDVALVLKVHSSNGTPIEALQAEMEAFLAARFGDRRVAPVAMLKGVLDDAQLPALYRAAQAFVLPSRGEGWGRPLMEAMATALPTIGTRWSANLAFMNDRNSYLVDCQVVDVPDAVLPQQPYYGGHRWAEPSVEHLRHLMRQVFREQAVAKARGLEARATVVKNFTPDVVGRTARSLIEEAAGAAESPRIHLGAPPLSGPVPGLPRVVWEGSFFETHSMALVNRELALALLGRGKFEVDVRVRQLEQERFDPRADPRLAPLLARVKLPPGDAPVAHLRHAWPPRFERPSHGKWVMIQPWEYGSLPLDWVAPMRDQVDEIWAYSNAVRQTYIESGIPAAKVHVVPLGADPERFRPDVPPLDLPTRKRFRFLFVGGTIWRKGILPLLEAYWRAFRRTDDVCLVIKGMGEDSYYKGQDAGDAIARVQADPDGPEVLYLTDPLPDDAVPGLYTACQALVHPYRGEGFGLPVAEAMACGLPPIVTRGGACDDFCTDDTAYWIPAVRRDVAVDSPTVGQAWVLEPDVAALTRCLQAAYAAPDEVAERGRRASAWIHQRFTWDAAAERAEARLMAVREDVVTASQAATRVGSGPVSAGVASGEPLIASEAGGASVSLGLEAFDEGRRLAGAGNWAAAEDALQRALQAHPQLIGARYLLGCAWLQQCQPEKALGAFRDAVAAMPEVSDFHNGLGNALRELGRVDEAVDAFERALQLNPANLEAHLNLAESQLELGNAAQAAVVLEKAQQLAPEDQEVERLDAGSRLSPGRPGLNDVMASQANRPPAR